MEGPDGLSYVSTLYREMMGWLQMQLCPRGIAADLVSCCVIGNEGSKRSLLGNLGVLLSDVWGLSDRQDGRVGRVADPWFVKSIGSCYSTKLQHGAECVMLRHRKELRAFSTYAAGNEAEESIAFEFRNCSKIFSRARVDYDSVLRNDLVESSRRRLPLPAFWELLCSSGISPQLICSFKVSH